MNYHKVCIFLYIHEDDCWTSTRSVCVVLRFLLDRLCGLVVSILVYRSGGPGSIPGTTKNNSGWGALRSSGSETGSTHPREYNWGALRSSGSGTGSTQPREYNWGALRSSGSGTGSTQPREYIWGALRSSGSGTGSTQPREYNWGALRSSVSGTGSTQPHEHNWGATCASRCTDSWIPGGKWSSSSNN
jgi:hypothetical protein